MFRCLKHAFPGDIGGRVEVTYRHMTTGWSLAVRDDGVGMSPPDAVKKVGLETSIVAALAQQLEASVVTADGEPGTRVELTHTSKAPDTKLRDRSPVAVPLRARSLQTVGAAGSCVFLMASSTRSVSVGADMALASRSR